jgi:hypothetical protein
MVVVTIITISMGMGIALVQAMAHTQAVQVVAALPFQSLV